MKRLLTFLLVLPAALSARAQFLGMPVRLGDRSFSVTVSVVDSLTAEAVPFASVYLKPEKDTIITNFTLSDNQGKAVVDRVVRGSYQLNVEMMGYRPFRKPVYLTGHADLGKVLLQQDAEMLEAAKVSAAVKALEVRQDTLIYNAAAFSVKETDVLRDLLRQMPGIEVEDNGSVKVQGETVSQITVNGKTFFMGDKQAALDNLPAKVVNKITVTDKDADMERITGIQRGAASRGKNMDVSLKQEYAQGLFGNIQAHGGTSIPGKEKNEMLASVPLLWNTSGMLSMYNKNDQLTLLARGQNVPAGNSFADVVARSGITTGGQAGANFTTDRFKKLRPGLSVYYNGTSRESAERSHSLDFPLSGDEVEGERTSRSINGNHRVTADLSLQFRSIKGIMLSVNPSFSFSDASSSGNSASSSRVNGVGSNASSSVNSSHTRTLGSQGDWMFATSRFSKAGRSLSVRGSYGVQGRQGTSRDYSLTEYAASHTRSERDLRYDMAGGSSSGSLNIAYGEPIAEKWIIQTGIQGFLQRSSQDKAAFNADGSANEYYSNQSVNNSASGSGSALLQYKSGDGMHVFQLGASLSADHLYTYSKAQGLVTELGEGEWLWNWAPVLSYTGPLFYLSYRGHSSQPSHDRMISLLDITDPLRISTGNRYLRPGFSHMVSLRLTPGKREALGIRSAGSFNLMLNASADRNPVVSAVWFDADRVRYSIPVNARKPGLTLSGHFSGASRLGKDKHWRLMYNMMLNFRRSVNYQPDGILSGIDTRTFDYDRFMEDVFWGDASGSRFYSGESGFRESLTRQLTFRPDFDLTYRDDSWVVTLGNSLSGSHAWYSLDGQADTHTWIYSASLNANYTTPHGFQLGTYYSLQRNFGFNDSFSKWMNNLNFNVMKDFRAFTFSAQVRDLLNNGLAVNHAVGATGTKDSYSLSLGRHFLVGVVWRFGKMGDVKLRKANQAADRINMTFGR